MKNNTSNKPGKAKMGRPKIGKGSVKVMISVEAGLLAAVDKFADKTGKARSELIAEGLRLVIGGAK